MAISLGCIGGTPNLSNAALKAPEEGGMLEHPCDGLWEEEETMGVQLEDYMQPGLRDFNMPQDFLGQLHSCQLLRRVDAARCAPLKATVH